MGGSGSNGYGPSGSQGGYGMGGSGSNAYGPSEGQEGYGMGGSGSNGYGPSGSQGGYGMGGSGSNAYGPSEGQEGYGMGGSGSNGYGPSGSQGGNGIGENSAIMGGAPSGAQLCKAGPALARCNNDETQERRTTILGRANACGLCARARLLHDARLRPHAVHTDGQLSGPSGGRARARTRW